MSLRLTRDANRQIQEALIEAYNKRLNKALNNGTALSKARSIAADAILKSDVVAAVLGNVDDLKEQIGFIAGTEKTYMDRIQEEVAQSTSFEIVRKRTYNIFRITVQPDHYTNLLSLAEATIKVDSARYGSYQLNWLEWFLKRGDEIIVTDFIYNENKDTGRAGGGIMTGASGRAWRVPPKYSGNETDNFISRALQSPPVVKAYMNLLEDIAKG